MQERVKTYVEVLQETRVADEVRFGEGDTPTHPSHWESGLRSGQCPSPEVFLIFGSRNAYFCSVAGPSDKRINFK